MAGTLEVNEASCWMPAGWAFDAVLGAVADQLASTDARRAAAIRLARTEGGSGYLDLRAWNAASLRLFLGAARAVRAQKHAAGPGAFHDPRGFSRYMAWIDELIAMVESDPRLARR